MVEVSIIIPTLNEEKHIKALLKTLRRQTYKDFEIIIIDGDSKDNTKKIVRKFAKLHTRVKLIIEKKKSVGRARNLGANQAKGKYLLFLDADTLLSRHFLGKSIAELEKKKLDIATADFRPLCKDSSHKIYFGMQNKIIWLSQFIRPAAQGAFILVKRSLFERIRGFDDRIKLAEDVNFVERATEFGKFGVLNEVRVSISSRRLKQEGVLGLVMKYLLCHFHREFIGEVKTDILKYKFGQHKKKTAPGKI
ncbi:MAG: glycosyltransferase [DPANN group archaeon]|nr:glycosyltransferase [DPANN group archaeon]